MRLHIVAEPPLTPEEVAERPTLADLLDAAFTPPVPAYADAALGRAFPDPQAVNIRRLMLARRP